MSLDGNDRADLIFAPLLAKNKALAAAHKPAMNQAELDALQANLRQMYSIDTTYLTTNAQIMANTLEVPAGIPVATSGSPAAMTGTTTAPQVLDAVGFGKLT